MKPESMDRLFHALASKHRRAILDVVRASPGCSVGHVSTHFDVSRIAVMKHLRVLEEADLLISEKHGRTRSLYLNVAPIQQIHERWTDEWSGLWAERLTEFKRVVEANQDERSRRNEMADVDSMVQKMIENMPEKTGKTLEQWMGVLKKSGLEKHGELVKHLKADHGMTHGFANLAVTQYRNAGKAADDPVEAQYSGAKAEMRPIYEALIKVVAGLGKDVEVSPRKSYVSLRRKKQFALIQASTKDRIDVGLILKGESPTDRLEDSGSFNKMVTHRVRINSKQDVNTELKNWLKKAYQSAG